MEEATLDLENPEIVVFGGPSALRLRPGEAETHGITGVREGLFGRKLEDVKADWQKALGQLSQILAATESETPKGWGLDTINVSLGFNAKGRLIFIAEAGIEATVSLTFSRKDR